MLMLDRIWQDFLEIATQQVGSRVVETWLKAIVLEKWDAPRSIAYIKTPNSFIKDWVSQHYLPLIREHLARLFAVPTIEVVLINTSIPTEQAETVIPARKSEPSPEPTAIIEANTRTNIALNDTYLFDNFLVGQSNALSFAAAHTIAQNPGLSYNPLFVCGGSGMGKTHLLNAIGNEIKRKFKRLSVLYQPADRFVNEFVSAVRFDKADAFKERYKQLDVLIIDDIQFIAHKEQTQEAFFSIFNSLYETSKQIVCASDTYPPQLNGFSERLRSRLQGGLVVDMHAPSVEEKVMIIMRKAERAQVNIPTDLAHIIAIQTKSIREIEGVLIRLCAVASLTNQTVTADLAQKILARPKETIRVSIGLQNIADTVARHYNYTIKQLRSRSRSKDIALARQITMYLAKQLTDQSLGNIGRYLNRRNHTTVVHAVQRIHDIMQTNTQLALVIQNLQADLQR